MNGLFAGMYEADIKGGRPSIAPEKLLRAMLLLAVSLVHRLVHGRQRVGAHRVYEEP